MNRQGLLYTVIFSFVIAFLFVTLLAFADTGTREQVALNQEIARQRAILNALGIEYSGPEDVQAKFSDVEQYEEDGVELYRTTVDGETLVAKEFSGSGLWGTIQGILAVTADLDRAVGLEIVTHNETPGLGGRIDEPWFKEQLRGEKIVDGTIDVGGAGDGDEDRDNGSIDAITGASRTSDSMRTILANEISSLESILGGNS
jgi:Na+-transporting NADH:ubiquinone oxidoreductase subunit C